VPFDESAGFEPHPETVALTPTARTSGS